MEKIERKDTGRIIKIHPGLVRFTHWINAAAILLMISSGLRIYNASPLFAFKFPKAVALGGWLGGALQWHFAVMWLLAINGIIYVLYGIASGHFKRSFFPITAKEIASDLKGAIHGKLVHHVGVYSALQRSAYLGVILLVLLLILSGLAIWKPVQLQELAAVMGGYEGARLVHFFAMVVLALFIVGHVIMVLLVPSTFLPMLTGRARTHDVPSNPGV